MKRRKEYMPRRGLRFDRSSQSGLPAGYVGGSVEVMVASGSVERSATSDVGKSLASLGHFYEDVYTRNLQLGLSQVGLGPASSVIVGSNEGARPPTTTAPRTGSIPSWTNVHLGQNSSFVGRALSASDHEVTTLGMYRSGTEGLEQSPVPASGNLYYSKHGRYTTVVVKKTASLDDLTRLPAGVDGATPVLYIPGKGTDITRVTGTLQYIPQVGSVPQYSTVLLPAIIPINVPFQGKIVDVKVWLELAQVSGSGATDGLGGYPLGNLTVAIRSPNVRGFHAHPIRNDETLKKVFTSDLSEFSAFSIFGSIGRSFFGPDYIAPSYRDAFILWEGPGFVGEGTVGPWDVDEESGGGEHFATRKYPSWQRDRSMRTVFSDGAAIPNPRHLIGPSPSASYNGSPNSAFGINSAYGFDVPWTSETEISGANTYASAGSPPKGWLNGPGGTNLTNEWPTTGVNYGAEYIRPLYPMLDPLYQRKRYGDIARRPNTGSAIFDPGKWTGYRPGLRGTEVSGTWHLIIADSRPAFAGDIADVYTPTYFRQVRLEFVLETSPYSDARVRTASEVRARRASDEVLVLSISGSDSLIDSTGSWDAHVSDTYLARLDKDVSSEIGRTIGIAFLTGSAESSADVALLYRLSGTLADLSGTTPSWMLRNPFGMPSIPLSSASLAPTTFEPIVGMQPQDVLTERPILDGARRLSDAARDARTPKTRAIAAAELVTGSLT